MFPSTVWTLLGKYTTYLKDNIERTIISLSEVVFQVPLVRQRVFVGGEEVLPVAELPFRG